MKKTTMILVSTKTGDTGKTGLANGQRIAKSNAVFEVIGDIDELNSWLGLVVVKLESSFEEQKGFLLKVQDTLFYIGAELANSPKAHLTKDHLSELEKVATELQESMSDNWYTKFLLPGGTELGAWLDISRTVCRRAERAAWDYSEESEVSAIILKYLNRLSDYLYLLRCFVNQALEFEEKKFIRK